MPANKTQPTKTSVADFLNAIEITKKREDAYKVLEIYKTITQEDPVIWGPSLIGFEKYHYKYDIGREGDFFITGFSPRKTALSIYIMSGISRHAELLSKLGKFKPGKSCLYIKKLDDIDISVLKELISDSVNWMRKNY